MTNFASLTPKFYKINLIVTLITRAFNICSSYFSLDTELKKLSNILTMNGFPINLIDSVIGCTLPKLHDPLPRLPTVPRRLVYFPIVYSGPPSLRLRDELVKLTQKFFPQIKLRCFF